MINQDPNDTQKNYVGAGGDVSEDAPAVIGTEEELAKLLGTEIQQEDDSNNEPPEVDDDGNPIVKEGAEEEDDGAGEEGKEDKIYASPIHYLDDRFKLNLNLENYPQDTPAEDALEAVGDMFERVVQNANAKISEYKAIVDALEDEEVKAFVNAKKEGKTMRDFVQQYAMTPDGMADEAIVRQDLQKQYPKFSEDQIEDLLSSYREKEMVEGMASNIRERWKAAEDAKRQADEQKATQQAEADKQRRAEEIANYKAFVDSKADVHGIPLTDDVKQEIFLAATQPVDEQGNTYLDQVLQSSEGVFLATLGVLHLQKLLKAKGTALGNKHKRSLLDRLNDSPDALQGGGTEGNKTPDNFDADIANLW